MDKIELLNQIFNLCIIPLLGVLTTFLVRFINSKLNVAIEQTNSELEKKYLLLLNETIKDCVLATTQTYVDSLKKEGKFDIEAQKKAFSMTYEAVLALLTQDAIEFLQSSIGDIELYITQKIEAEVKSNKNI